MARMTSLDSSLDDGRSLRTYTPPTTTTVTMPPLSDPYPPVPVSNPITVPPMSDPYPPVPVTNTGTPISVPPMSTPLPPMPVSSGTPINVPPMSDPYPPVPVTNPPVSVPPTGGPLPPTPVPSFTLPPLTDLGGFGPINGQDFVAQATPGSQGSQVNPGDVVQQYLNSLLSRNSTYMRNARQRGLEAANQRGMLNSSIAAGASERAAIEAAQPFVSEMMGLHRQREQLAFQGEENALNRIQGVNDALLASKLQLRQLQASGVIDRDNMVAQMQLQAQIQQLQSERDFEFRRALQNDSVMQQDWLRSRQFNEEFNAQLSMMPVTNSVQFLQAFAQMAAQDPETYTPDVISGFTNFFNNTMLQLLSNYFPNSVQQGGS